MLPVVIGLAMLVPVGRHRTDAFARRVHLGLRRVDRCSSRRTSPSRAPTRRAVFEPRISERNLLYLTPLLFVALALFAATRADPRLGPRDRRSADAPGRSPPFPSDFRGPRRRRSGTRDPVSHQGRLRSRRRAASTGSSTRSSCSPSSSDSHPALLAPAATRDRGSSSELRSSRSAGRSERRR